MRLPPVETTVIPAIVMNGTTPVLYKFEITGGPDVAVFAESDEGTEFSATSSEVGKVDGGGNEGGGS
jgi:hypothetical protein